MTYNKFNNTTLVGRLATDPDERTNTDGSTKVYLKIYVKTTFQGNNGQTVEECIDVEAYVPANTKSPYIFCVSDLYGAMRAKITDKDAASRNLGIISDTDMYLNSKINYGDIIDELKKITKDTPGIISDIYIFDATCPAKSHAPSYHQVLSTPKSNA